jgi:hypothetical protein
MTIPTKDLRWLLLLATLVALALPATCAAGPVVKNCWFGAYGSEIPALRAYDAYVVENITSPTDAACRSVTDPHHYFDTGWATSFTATDNGYGPITSFAVLCSYRLAHSRKTRLTLYGRVRGPIETPFEYGNPFPTVDEYAMVVCTTHAFMPPGHWIRIR